MAVPKQKKGRGATHTRRSANSKLDMPARSTCPQCGAVKLPHRVCPSCGYYKGREVIVTEQLPNFRVAREAGPCRAGLFSVTA